MARRIMHSTDPEDDPYEGLPSRGDIRAKEQAITDQLAELGLALAALSPAQRKQLELPEPLELALSELSKASKGARVRQRRFVARQLRGYNAEALQHAVALLDPTSAVSLARAQLIERWRDRLTHETLGDEACEEFLVACPLAERQRLRQLVRGAVKEAEGGSTGQGKRANAKRRALYQHIRECLAAADPRPTSPATPKEDDGSI